MTNVKVCLKCCREQGIMVRSDRYIDSPDHECYMCGAIGNCGVYEVSFSQLDPVRCACGHLPTAHYHVKQLRHNSTIGEYLACKAYECDCTQYARKGSTPTIEPEPSKWNLKRALTLLRASSELPPDAGWECVAKAREILEREVEE